MSDEGRRCLQGAPKASWKALRAEETGEAGAGPEASRHYSKPITGWLRI